MPLVSAPSAMGGASNVVRSGERGGPPSLEACSITVKVNGKQAVDRCAIEERGVREQLVHSAAEKA